ncbi:MAG TPA: hypothetical protein PLP19_07595 [bacterium]|nr:hypothetical protein [bacterium]HPN43335.1 hypothetical protein [bacterium]
MVWIEWEKGPFNTFPEVYQYVVQLDWKFYLSYINAVILTLCVALFFTALAKVLANVSKFWAFTGFILIPLYCAINLFVYLSQITLVPHLVKAIGLNFYSPAVFFLQTRYIHLWRESTVSIINIVGYSILGITSIIYGALLWKAFRNYRFSALLLAANGVACIIGTCGILLHSSIMQKGTIIGGIFFLLAQVPFFTGLVKNNPKMWRIK